MDDERNQNDPNFPEDDSSHPHYIHQLSEIRGVPAVLHDAPGLPTAAPWDMPPFFPVSAYDQQSTYDMLALGGMNPMPGVGGPGQHPSPHAPFDPFSHPSWDLNFLSDLQRPQSQPPQLQPLSPAEIAQYHALMARGAAAFPPPITPTPHATTQTPGASSSSAPASVTAPIAQAEHTSRGRSMSSAGRGSTNSQPSPPASPLDEETAIAVAEDKRKRNTAASARFRMKKKQRTAELERILVELEGRAGELEKEAVELRRENGWLKEMVILKGRKAMETAKAGSTSGSRKDQDKPESGEAESRDGEESEGGEKGKSKE
ncbi:basic region leucine zipper protein [Ceratobasidium sp. AG-Ba]|nr:basic region leucine zipper protein [Ceratobasidium sp. AG-Ba]